MNGIFILNFILLLSISLLYAQCPDASNRNLTFIQWPETGDCFVRLRTYATYDEATELCNELNSRLLSIRSMEEQQWVFETFEEYTVHRNFDEYPIWVWLGATHQPTPWMWTDGVNFGDQACREIHDLNFTTMLQQGPEVTFSSCRQSCQDNGYQYASLYMMESDVVCNCNEDFQNTHGLPMSQCQTPCPSGATEFCGSQSASLVAYITGISGNIWDNGHPSYGGKCMMLYPPFYKIRTTGCSYTRAQFICEWVRDTLIDDPPPTRIPINGKQYAFYSSRASLWWEAYDICLSHGGRLASIENTETLDEIIQVLQDQDDYPVWIGGTGTFYKWQEGDFVDYTHWGWTGPSASSSYLCTIIYMDSPMHPGLWNEADCSARNDVICKYASDSDSMRNQEETTTQTVDNRISNAITTDCPFIPGINFTVYPATGDCYVRFEQDLSYIEAKQRCEDIDSMLLSIKSEEEGLWVTDTFQQTTFAQARVGYPWVWLGLKSERIPWTWIDGDVFLEQACKANNDDIDVLIERSLDMTNSKCRERCRELGYIYAALTIEDIFVSCHCGNSFPREEDLMIYCQEVCPSNTSQICGSSTHTLIVHVDGIGTNIWDSDEPDENGNCIVLYPVGYKIKPYTCQALFYFICEYEMNTGSYMNVGNKSLSFEEEEPVFWWDAHKKCLTQGGRLLKIDNDEFHQELVGIIQNMETYPRHVGAKSHVWKWQDGEVAEDYTSWDFGGPSSETDMCAVINIDDFSYRSKWRQVSCNEVHGMICKHTPKVTTTETSIEDTTTYEDDTQITTDVSNIPNMGTTSVNEIEGDQQQKSGDKLHVQSLIYGLLIGLGILFLVIIGFIIFRILRQRAMKSDQEKPKDVPYYNTHTTPSFDPVTTSIYEGIEGYDDVIVPPKGHSESIYDNKVHGRGTFQ